MEQEPSKNSLFFTLSDLCHNRNRLLGLGIVLVGLGLLAIGAAFFTTLITVVLIGGILLAGGLMQIVQSFWARTHGH
ncbi:MAG TPA: DUF308 domain-containing protein, partial [Candidatus Babeliaceae bacterium]|nr:DUF308 domain-containing protein [Candidatus Babeliaceae bacterium]